MSHTWRFVRAGGFDQVAIDSADDLRNLPQLDKKLWVALACPVVGNELDPATLALIDADGDGRIRAPELLAAIAWIDGKLKDLGAVLKGADGLALDNLSDPALLASAKRILEGRGKAGTGTLTVADTAGANALLDAMPFNGDGVVTAAATDDAALQAVIGDIVASTGGSADRSGTKGIGRGDVDAFYAALADYDGWRKQAETEGDALATLGADTAAAVEAFGAVRAKIDDYFTRCALAAFDARSQAHLAGAEGVWGSIADRTLSAGDDAIKAFPLATIGAGRPLPLGEGVNPAWAAAMRAFRAAAVKPALGDVDTLTEAAWADLKGRLAAYEGWLGRKAGAAVEPLGLERVRALLAADHKPALLDLIAKDEAVKPEAEAIGAVDRAARYHRDLITLVRNFVTFRDLYDPRAKAMFQAGTLYLDGRSCDLVLRVNDAGKHAAMAAQSFAYLAYCDCARPATGEKLSIVAAFTDGDSDFLAVGRNGLFFDRNGKDWDATITKVVEQPISIRQAFWAPYKRVVKFVSDQAEKFAADQDAKAQSDLTAKADANLVAMQQRAATDPAAAPAAPAAPADTKAAAFDMGKYAGIFAAVGLAMGFVVSSVTMLVTGFMSLPVWQMPLAILAGLLVISGPSMLLAAFKLSRRNLAPLLDANGWAINTRAKLNIPFGASMTQVAKLPANSKRELSDPYAEKPTPWRLYGAVVVLLCVVAYVWDFGLESKLKGWLGVTADATAPAAAPAPAEAPPAP